MTRPKNYRCMSFLPNVTYFKPKGVPLRQLEEISVMADEIEALKLHDIDGLEQIEASVKMKISQPTFGRILNSAYKKIADAIINGKAIKIEKNDAKSS